MMIISAPVTVAVVAVVLIMVHVTTLTLTHLLGTLLLGPVGMGIMWPLVMDDEKNP